MNIYQVLTEKNVVFLKRSVWKIFWGHENVVNVIKTAGADWQPWQERVLTNLLTSCVVHGESTIQIWYCQSFIFV